MAERNPGDASNEQAPPINNGGGGGSRFGRIAIIVVALILLLLAVPFACQAIRGSGGSEGASGGADSGSSESGGSAEQTSGGSASETSQMDSQMDSQMESTMQAATGSTSMEETAAEGTTVMSSSDDDGSSEAPEAELAGLASGQLTGQSGDGSSITIPSATLSGASGWVAVSEEEENGEPGEVIGYAPLEEGANEDVNVSLDSPVSGSGELVVSVHEDAPADDSFTYPDGDPTTETADGEPAVETVPYDLDSTSGEGVQDSELPDTSGALAPGPYLTLAIGAALLALGAALQATIHRGRERGRAESRE